MLQPHVQASSGSRVPRRGGSRSAKTATFGRRCSLRWDLAPHTRLPRADQRDPRGCHFPSPLQLPLPCMQGVLKLFFFPVSIEIQIFSARPFKVRPLRPSWQCLCQQKLLVAASGMLSVHRAPGIYWLMLPSEGRQYISSLGPQVDSPIFAFWPLYLAKRNANCAHRAESPWRPHIRPPLCRRLPGSAPARPACPLHCPYRGSPDCRGSAFAALNGREQPPAPLAPATAGSAPAGGAPALLLRAGPCWACSVRLLEAGSPGAGISSPCFCSCRGGAEEGRLGDSQSLVLCPLPRVRLRPPHRKMRANQGRGAGLVPSRPPSGLIESYIKKFSSEERRGRRREGQRRSERGRASKTGRSALESLKHERDNRLGIFLATVTPESSRRITITPTLTFPTRS